MHPLVILVDVDNTLLDGQAVRASITAALERAVDDAATAFWQQYEAVRVELGRVDVPEVARRVEVQRGLAPGSLNEALEGVDFAASLAPRALAVLAHLATLGLTVVLSDGDARFQRRKIAAAGIEVAVEGRVLVVPHKERALDLVVADYPAAHYALLDDRPGILGAVKAALADRVTTIRVRQGRYARERAGGGLPAPDLEIPQIEAALGLDARALLGRSSSA